MRANAYSSTEGSIPTNDFLCYPTIERKICFRYFALIVYIWIEWIKFCSKVIPKLRVLVFQLCFKITFIQLNKNEENKTNLQFNSINRLKLVLDVVLN